MFIIFTIPPMDDPTHGDPSRKSKCSHPIGGDLRIHRRDQNLADTDSVSDIDSKSRTRVYAKLCGTPFFRLIENTPSIYLLPMCWRWRCRARFRCSQFSNLIRASPLRRPDSFKTRDTPPDGIFNPRKKFAFHRVSKQSLEFENGVVKKVWTP